MTGALSETGDIQQREVGLAAPHCQEQNGRGHACAVQRTKLRKRTKSFTPSRLTLATVGVVPASVCRSPVHGSGRRQTIIHRPDEAKRFYVCWRSQKCLNGRGNVERHFGPSPD